MRRPNLRRRRMRARARSPTARCPPRALTARFARALVVHPGTRPGSDRDGRPHRELSGGWRCVCSPAATCTSGHTYLRADADGVRDCASIAVCVHTAHRVARLRAAWGRPRGVRAPSTIEYVLILGIECNSATERSSLFRKKQKKFHTNCIGSIKVILSNV